MKRSVVPSVEIPAHVSEHFVAQSRSGLTIKAYCARHSISAWSFYQWRKRYRKAKLSAPATPSFSEVGLLDLSGGVCDIRFPGGVTVSVHRGAPKDELTSVFSLVSGMSRC